MRIIKCDVCGDDYEPGADMIEMTIPASFVEAEGDGITIDVCSFTCVEVVVDGALGRAEEADKEEQPEESERFIAVPKAPTIGTDLDEKSLAKFTEQVTGVKRR